MRETKRSPGRITLTILDAVLSVAVLMLALQIIQSFNVDDMPEDLNYTKCYGAASWLFFIMAVVELIRFFLRRGRTKLDTVRRLGGVGLFAVSGVLLIVLHGDNFSSAFAGLSYTLFLALGRVVAILRHRRVRSTITNILALLLIALLLGTVIRLIFMPLFLLLLSLVHIGGIAFSQIDLRALEKVVRKTYAVEIIFGMLLMMVAFSIVLQSSETGIETFGDALWYCFAIVTTIGFGDFTVTGTVGRVLSVILGIYGIIVVSLITSVIVNFYNEVKDEAAEDAPPPLPSGEGTEGSKVNEEETP